MDLIYALAIAAVPLLVGSVVIWAIIKSAATVKKRPQELAAAVAPLGLAPQPNAEGCAEQVLAGTIHASGNAAAAARGRTAEGEVSIVDLRFQTGGRGRFSNLETIAVFHGPSGLPRMVLQPSLRERPVSDGLEALKFDDDEGEDAEVAFGYSYSVHASDEAAVRARLGPAFLAELNRLDDAGQAPVLDVLPDRVAFCWPRKGVEPKDLPAFLAEGRRLVALLKGG
ncbi:MAG: hypothetical protein HY901_05440 [Deltaproteobacteria bacterium]|nr:hypothetical protein [Deltaproteobacteria bacterium]